MRFPRHFDRSHTGNPRSRAHPKSLIQKEFRLWAAGRAHTVGLWTCGRSVHPLRQWDCLPQRYIIAEGGAGSSARPALFSGILMRHHARMPSTTRPAR